MPYRVQWSRVPNSKTLMKPKRGREKMRNKSLHVFLRSWGGSAPIGRKAHDSWGHVSYESLLKVVGMPAVSDKGDKSESGKDSSSEQSSPSTNTETTLVIMNDAELMTSFEKGVRDSKAGRTISTDELLERVSSRTTKRRRAANRSGVELAR
jgi:hypothetical protein